MPHHVHGASAAPSSSQRAALAEALLQRILARKAKVGVLGLGYVGLPLVRAIVEAGFAAIGFDVDPEKVAELNAGRSRIRHIPNESVARLRQSGRFEASDQFERVREVDVLLVCVPTPLSRHREPDLSFVVGTAEAVVPHLRSGQLFVLESTTYPGTTEEIVRPILARAGADLFLAYSPEREDPGNIDFGADGIPKVVGGDGDDALRLAQAFYDQFVSRTVPVSSPAVAEAAKLTENVFRAVNIALVNELKIVFDAMGISVWEVIDAAKTKPFGYMPFYPGPGLGGHCIPIDPFYLTWKAREHDISTRFIELAGEVNLAMPRYVVERLARALDERFAKGLNGARILVVGVAYKKNVEDVRESPALTIMELLEARGVRLDYHDPFVPVIPRTREHGRFAGRQSQGLDPEFLKQVDAAMIVTDHDAVDYEALVADVRLVIDTRNVTKQVRAHRDRIVLA